MAKLMKLGSKRAKRMAKLVNRLASANADILTALRRAGFDVAHAEVKLVVPEAMKDELDEYNRCGAPLFASEDYIYALSKGAPLRTAIAGVEIVTPSYQTTDDEARERAQQALVDEISQSETEEPTSDRTDPVSDGLTTQYEPEQDNDLWLKRLQIALRDKSVEISNHSACTVASVGTGYDRLECTGKNAEDAARGLVTIWQRKNYIDPHDPFDTRLEKELSIRAHKETIRARQEQEEKQEAHKLAGMQEWLRITTGDKDAEIQRHGSHMFLARAAGVTSALASTAQAACNNVLAKLGHSDAATSVYAMTDHGKALDWLHKTLHLDPEHNAAQITLDATADTWRWKASAFGISFLAPTPDEAAQGLVREIRQRDIHEGQRQRWERILQDLMHSKSAIITRDKDKTHPYIAMALGVRERGSTPEEAVKALLRTCAAIGYLDEEEKQAPERVTQLRRLKQAIGNRGTAFLEKDTGRMGRWIAEALGVRTSDITPERAVSRLIRKLELIRELEKRNLVDPIANDE